MKKSILIAVIIIAVIILAGLYFLGAADNNEEKAKTTAELIAEAFGKEYSRPANTVIIEVTADNGSFAKGTARFAGEASSGVWFAARTINGWELASFGNGIVACNEINKYNFPKDIAPQCIDTENNNNLIIR